MSDTDDVPLSFRSVEDMRADLADIVEAVCRDYPAGVVIDVLLARVEVERTFKAAADADVAKARAEGGKAVVDVLLDHANRRRARKTTAH